ncbi:MAG: hypothetical protein NC120_08425 [Ruminococcus sp.]|nr:hypothetical protein [Ruminococcus sp.]
MADLKYAKFFMGTVIKLAVFLLLCAGSGIAGRFMEPPVSRLVPSALVIVLSWLFLSYAEGGKRSFFSKGYMTENIVTGGMFGIGAVFLAAGAAFLTGGLTAAEVNTQFDLTETFLETVSVYFFGGLVFYGYFFHIVQKDFGSIASVILSSLLFTVYMSFDGAPPALSEEYVKFINIFLIGAAAGMLIVFLGDMRSAVSFLFLFGLCRSFIEGGRGCAPIINISGGLGTDGVVFTVIMILVIITLLLQIKKDGK